MGQPALDHHWYAVASTDQVVDQPLPVTLRYRDYVLWRDSSGQVAAVLDQCSHRQARLSAGLVEGECIRCPYHGWAFGIDGRCVDIPSSGPDTAIAPAAHLNALAVEERYGLVWICPGEPLHPIPRVSVDEDPAFTRLNTGTQLWSCSATRMIDNMLDVAHFPYTHIGTFGRDAAKQVPHFTLTQLDDTFHGYEYEVEVNNDGDAKAMSGGGDDIVNIAMSTGFALPFSVRSTMAYDNGIEQTLFMTAAPGGADSNGVERSYFTFVLWRNDDVSVSGAEIVDFEIQVALEDQQMLEGIPGELSLDRGALVDTQSDKASVEWRRQLRELIDYSDAAS
ncbi:MAG: Rieske 2Fe-2S domain-containing protein [Acidimicrobiales bacterium]